MAVDQSSTPHHLYVADTYNNRVLGWNNDSTFYNGKPADLVIGEPNFNTSSANAGTGVNASGFYYPWAVAVDSHGDLYVVDENNSRVLEFNVPFASCSSFPCVGGAATVVFGQGNNLTSSGCNYSSNTISADSLCYPTGVQLDALDNLYIADSYNHRVLEFNTPLTVTGVQGSGDTTADLVFGQDNAGVSFTTNQCNQPSSTPSANNLCYPGDVGIDSVGNVYISDNNNSRVLEYNETSSPPSNVTANNVLGQSGSLTNNGCPGTSATTLCYPVGLTLDSSNDLFVADGYYNYSYYAYGHNRVLEFNNPLSSATANEVFGQLGNFTAGGCNLGAGQAHPNANTLCGPSKAAIDSDGAFFIADSVNNRVTIYNLPVATPTATATTTNSPTPTPTNSATATATRHCDGYQDGDSNCHRDTHANGDCDCHLATATATATATPTATATATQTATATATQTATATATATKTATATPTTTATATATATQTARLPRLQLRRLRQRTRRQLRRDLLRLRLQPQLRRLRRLRPPLRLQLQLRPRRQLRQPRLRQLQPPRRQQYLRPRFRCRLR